MQGIKKSFKFGPNSYNVYYFILKNQQVCYPYNKEYLQQQLESYPECRPRSWPSKKITFFTGISSSTSMAAHKFLNFQYAWSKAVQVLKQILAFWLQLRWRVLVHIDLHYQMPTKNGWTERWMKQIINNKKYKTTSLDM